MDVSRHEYIGAYPSLYRALKDRPDPGAKAALIGEVVEDFGRANYWKSHVAAKKGQLKDREAVSELSETWISENGVEHFEYYL